MVQLDSASNYFPTFRDSVAIPGLEPRPPGGTGANSLPHVTHTHPNHPALKLHASCCPSYSARWEPGTGRSHMSCLVEFLSSPPTAIVITR